MNARHDNDLGVRIPGTLVTGIGRAHRAGGLEERRRCSGLDLVPGTLNLKPDLLLGEILKRVEAVHHRMSEEPPHATKGLVRMWRGTIRDERRNHDEHPCVLVRLEGSTAPYLEIMSNIRFRDGWGLGDSDRLVLHVLEPLREDRLW